MKMKIIELENIKTNSTLALLLIGMLSVPFFERILNILNSLFFLINKSFGLSILVNFYFSYVLNSLVILGLIYLIVLLIRKNSNKSYLIELKQKHIKYFMILFLIVYPLNILINYLTQNPMEAGIQKYLESTSSYQIDIHEFVGRLFSFLRGLLVVLILLLILVKERSE